MRLRLQVLIVAILALGCDNSRDEVDAGTPLMDSGVVPRDTGPGVTPDTGVRPDSGPVTPTGTCPNGDLAMAEGDAVATGVTSGLGNHVTPSCTDSATDDAVYTWTAPRSGGFVFDTMGSDFDTVLALLSGNTCTGAELECDDDGAEVGLTSRIYYEVTEGTTYAIVVDGYADDKGPFALNINEGTEDEVDLCADSMDNDRDGAIDCDDFDCYDAAECSESGEDECSDGEDNDGDTYADCEDSQCYSTEHCTERGAECEDGEDNDGDESIDCEDFDCYAEPACVEEGDECSDTLDNDGDDAADCADTDCATDPACIEDGDECGDTLDNDDDGAIDCVDPDCARFPACDTCVDTDLAMATGAMVHSGTTAGGYDRREPAAEDCYGGAGPDLTFEWTAPSAGTFQIDTNGSEFDTVLYVLDGGCAGTEVACDDDGGDVLQSLVTVTATAGQTFVLVVDGYGSSSSGAFVINITPM